MGNWRGYSETDRARSLQTRRLKSAERQAKAVELHHKGLDNLTIAEEIGISHITVCRLLRAAGAGRKAKRDRVKSALPAIIQQGLTRDAMAAKLGIHVNTLDAYLKELENEQETYQSHILYR